MADFDSIRHALRLARERGFAEVSLEDGELEFKAVLAPDKAKAKAKAASAAAIAEGEQQETGPVLLDITAPLVGYYFPSPTPLAVGSTVASGDIVAIIAQLGIANDVESKVAGEVVELCVGENEPVMFGQVIARVKEL